MAFQIPVAQATASVLEARQARNGLGTVTNYPVGDG
jgi:hypothetical protein